MHTILVVEDDLAIRTALRDLFEINGYKVFSAENGANGLAVLRGIKPPCIIVLDQMMPLLDGAGFLKAKNSNPDLAPIPVIVMSAIEDQVSHLGAHAFLRKPLDIDAVLKAVNDHCREH